jgi:hypothetical protein
LNKQLIKVAGFFWVLVILPFLVSHNADAQQERPSVSVSVYLTEEKKACRPDGYPNKSRDRKSACEKSEYEELDLYKFGEPIIASVPPECLPLGDLAEEVKRATEDCPIYKYCTKPELRKAIVLVFHFQMENPQGREVKFIRVIPRDLEQHFEMDPYKGTYIAEGTLDVGGHWINHQRADLFLPDYGVEWTLYVDGHIYEIGTRKGIKVNETGEWKCDPAN